MAAYTAQTKIAVHVIIHGSLNLYTVSSRKFWIFCLLTYRARSLVRFDCLSDYEVRKKVAG